MADREGPRPSPEALARSERTYRALFESNPQPMWIYDLESLRFLAVNDAAVSRYGYSRREFLEMTIADIRPPEDRDRLLENVHAVTEGLDSAGLWRHRTKGGALLEVEITSHTLEFEGRRAELVLAWDLTARRTAEAELRSNRADLEQAQKQARIGSWTLDLETKTGVWSAEMYRLFDLEPGRGPPGLEEFFDLVHPEDRLRLRRAHERGVASTETVVTEFRSSPDRGPLRYFEARFQGERDERGVVSRLVGTVQDMTERVELEAQLRHAQKMETLGRMAGSIAHDFNNLLTVINGYAELLRLRLPDDAAGRPMVDLIAEAGTRAAVLTRQLLTFSRREAVEAGVLDLNEAVERMRPLVDQLLDESVELVVRLGQRPCSIELDRGRLEQVVMNLVVNAQDAMPDGGRLAIETGIDERALAPEGAEPRPVALLRVRDTGHGMDAGTRERIFEPFFTTKEAGKGTGLGLSTVYGIVSQAGGRIDVDSAPGRGTTFEVVLPLQEAPDARPS